MTTPDRLRTLRGLATTWRMRAEENPNASAEASTAASALDEALDDVERLRAIVSLPMGASPNASDGELVAAVKANNAAAVFPDQTVTRLVGIIELLRADRDQLLDAVDTATALRVVRREK